MAYTCPRDLDSFIPHLGSVDNKFRQQVGTDLLNYLAEPLNPITCQDIGLLVDALLPWLQGSNFKVSSNGIEIMTFLVDRLGSDFRPYLQTVLPCVIDRLGDSRDTVREKSQLLILKLLEREVLSPQTLLEKLSPVLSHKNAKIREEVLRCFVNAINEYGIQSVSLSKFTPQVVKLLADPAGPVRCTAFSTLVDFYKHVGDKFRLHIQKLNLVPPSKLEPLLVRFDEVKASGELLASATTTKSDGNDELDRMSPPPPQLIKKMRVIPTSKRAPLNMRSASASNATSGAVDEDIFLRSFDDVTSLQIYSVRELNDQMKSIQDIIGDDKKDWNKRVDALKKLRGLIASGTSFDDFYVNLRNLEYPLQATIKDLRSQVVREACITIAYMSQSLENKFDHAAESLLNNLINIIQNSAKIISTSGVTCVKFIIQFTISSRLIPIITSNLQNSKSKEIRKSCCEFLEFILSNWPTNTLEKHVGILQDSIKKGIADADPDARVISRRAFRGFKDHFPDHAESLLHSLEPSYRKALQGDMCLSSSSSSGSLAQIGNIRPTRPYIAPPSQNAISCSNENLNCTLQRVPSLPRNYRQRSGIPVIANGNKGNRSNSAIDLQAAQRAKARAQYSAISRQKVSSGTASLPRPKKSPDTGVPTTPERVGRTRTKTSGISQSQPTSRSGSPSSRFNYLFNHRTLAMDSPKSAKRPVRLPKSTTGSRDTSREASPTRSSNLARYGRRNSDRPPMSPALRPPVMAQRILQQSREAENALADALDCDLQFALTSPVKTTRFDNHSDDSETSSICSERSFDLSRRLSDTYSWNGSQQRLINNSSNHWEACHDIREIIALCASTTWQERKDGLVSLRLYLVSDSHLTKGELQYITEIFTKMFMDSHTKGQSVFLDTLNELIRCHKQDLHEWLYVLFQRIFHKLGTDLLMSAQNKLYKTLENIRKSFPLDLQFSYIYKFLVDVTQTPNAKVKVAILNYLTSLCDIPDSESFVNRPTTSLALKKIIAYSQDGKSSDVRNAAKMCTVALWNCNIPQMTIMLTKLSKEEQDVASNIIQNHTKQMGLSSPGVGSPQQMLSPIAPINKQNNLNHDEVYRNLKKTSAEIQSYSYETLGPKLDRDRETTSQDSGISQMSIGNDIKNEIIAIEERMEKIHIKQTSTPISKSKQADGLNETDSNGSTIIEMNDEEVILKLQDYSMLELNDQLSTDNEKCFLLQQLLNFVKQGRVDKIKSNFKQLLRIFINTLGKKEVPSTILVLQILTEIFKIKELEESYLQFIELLTLRILEAYSDSQREIVKHAEATAASAMATFPFNTVIATLSPLIQTAPYPQMIGTIKIITKLIELQPECLTDEHLSNVMPGLVKANDHDQSSTRKSAVFCMVAMHHAAGEERLAPYIASLSASKVKLLQLYIGRNQPKSTEKDVSNFKSS